jgi:hypothetical protein
MTTTATVEIPRLENERAERYQARTLYTTMGPDRSLRAVAQKLNKSLTIVGRWSTEDDWPSLVAAYDQTLGNLAARDAAAAYRRDLEDHRKRYGDAGKSLWQVGARLLQELNAIITQPPKVIEGKDGRFYKIPGIELTPQTLAIAARAMTIAADLEAHALRLGDIFPRLDQGGGDL